MTSLWKPSIDIEKTKNIDCLSGRKGCHDEWSISVAHLSQVSLRNKTAERRRRQREGEKSHEFSYFHEITSPINRKHPSRHWYRKLKNLVSITYFAITLDSVSLQNKHYESSASERQEIWQALTDLIKLCQFETFKYQKSLEKLPIEASFDSACPLMFPSCHLRFLLTNLTDIKLHNKNICSNN